MNCSKKMKRKIHNFVIKALTALNAFSLIYWICWIDCIVNVKGRNITMTLQEVLKAQNLTDEQVN